MKPESGRISTAPVRMTDRLREYLGNSADRMAFYLVVNLILMDSYHYVELNAEIMRRLKEETGRADPRTDAEVMELLSGLAVEAGWLSAPHLSRGWLWSATYAADAARQYTSDAAKRQYVAAGPQGEELETGMHGLGGSVWKNGHRVHGAAARAVLKERDAERKAREKALKKQAAEEEKAAKEAEKAAEKQRKAEEKERAAKRAPAVEDKHGDPILEQMYASSMVPAGASAERIYGSGETEAERNVREARHAAKMGRLKDQLEEARVKTEIAEQQQATRQAKYSKPRRGNRFTDFEQRNTYDFEQLEKKKRRQQFGMHYDEEPDMEQDEGPDIEQTQEQGVRGFEDFYRAGARPATSAAEQPAMTQ